MEPRLGLARAKQTDAPPLAPPFGAPTQGTQGDFLPCRKKVQLRKPEAPQESQALGLGEIAQRSSCWIPSPLQPRPRVAKAARRARAGPDRADVARQGLRRVGRERRGGVALPLAESSPWAWPRVRTLPTPLAEHPQTFHFVPFWPPLRRAALRDGRAGPGRAVGRTPRGAMRRLLPLLRTILWATLLGSPLRGGSGLRHPLYWNSSNPR